MQTMFNGVPGVWSHVANLGNNWSKDVALGSLTAVFLESRLVLVVFF